MSGTTPATGCGSGGAAFGEGVACDVLPEPELAGDHRRCRGRRVHSARHGDEENIAALGAWTRERPDRAVVAQTMAALSRGLRRRRHGRAAGPGHDAGARRCCPKSGHSRAKKLPSVRISGVTPAEFGHECLTALLGGLLYSRSSETLLLI